MNQFSCFNTNLIDISGLCDPESVDLFGSPYWTQIFIPETLTIPAQKPDIEQINSVNISANIIRKKVVVTPTALVENEEGKWVTGRKLVVEGELCQKVVYTADEPSQAVHSAHLYVPFSAFIVVPPDYNGIDTQEVVFQVNVCIEDVFIKSFTKRLIFKNVTLLLQAVPVSIMDCN